MSVLWQVAKSRLKLQFFRAWRLLSQEKKSQKFNSKRIHPSCYIYCLDKIWQLWLFNAWFSRALKTQKGPDFAGQHIHKICWIAGQATILTLFMPQPNTEMQLANFRAFGRIKDIALLILPPPLFLSLSTSLLYVSFKTKLHYSLSHIYYLIHPVVFNLQAVFGEGIKSMTLIIWPVIQPEFVHALDDKYQIPLCGKILSLCFFCLWH